METVTLVVCVSWRKGKLKSKMASGEGLPGILQSGVGFPQKHRLWIFFFLNYPGRQSRFFFSWFIWLATFTKMYYEYQGCTICQGLGIKSKNLKSYNLMYSWYPLEECQVSLHIAMHDGWRWPHILPTSNSRRYVVRWERLECDAPN